VTARRDDVKPPRPWHLLLSPALPVLALLAGGLSLVGPRAAIWSIGVTVSAAVLSWVVLSRLVGNALTSALVVSVLSLTVLSQSTIARLTASLAIPNLLPLVSVWAILLCAFILRFAGEAKAATTFANALMVSATLLVSLPIIRTQVQTWRTLTLDRSPVDVPHTPPARARPDVYVLILDGYARADVLREYYGFENGLIGHLRSAGFFIAERASSNYGQTAQSLASSLNLEYLPALIASTTSAVRARRGFGELIAKNRTFEAFAAAGYRIRAYASEYGMIRPEPADERPHPFVYLTDFEYSMYEASILPQLSVALGYPPGWTPMALHRRQVTWTLDHLERELPATDDAPTLVFAHLLIPHPPFAFDADGAARASRLPANLTDGDHWRINARSTGERYETGYVDAIKFLNSRLVRIVERVRNRLDGRRTIVYLQADHGPGSRLTWEDPDSTDFRERLGIMLAIRFPDGDPGAVAYPSLTPINGFRILLNSALSTRLPLLEDRSYFSRWRQPFEFIDVTDRVR
jgi:hypothetical protein